MSAAEKAQRYALLEKSMRKYAENKYSKLSYDIWQYCVSRWNYWQGVANGQPQA